jgi:hypothetical protein
VAARPNGEPQSPDALVHDIEKTRDQLAETIDALVDRASPANIASRQLDRLKAQFVAEDGSPRVDQISKAAGAVLGFLTVIVLIRRVAG